MLKNITRSYATAPVKVTSTSSTLLSAPLASVRIVVANAGSKASPAGLAHLLSRSNAVTDTDSKSALRLHRESELLGGQVQSKVTRDSIILSATFLKEHAPFFVSSIADLLTKTVYKPYEYAEIIKPAALADYLIAHGSSSFVALEELHSISFRRGLGNPLLYDGVSHFSHESLKAYAAQVYTRDSILVTGSNLNEADLSSFVADSSFSDLSVGNGPPSIPQKQFLGVESRIRRVGATTAVLGVPLEISNLASYQLVVSNLVARGFDSKVLSYDDGALFYASVSGSTKEVTARLRDLKKALSDITMTYAHLAATQVARQSLSVKIEGSSAANLSKTNLVVVGDVDGVPYLDEL
ncbi:hypothetical protein LJB42_001260 [Komagataella kurtzmanii]|nr:hypothetical protein LJB42_001260 [Komagataella kurtzmanii]